MERERRAISEAVELRVNNEAPTVSGYAALFNEEATIAGMFRERIAPGAFAGAVKTDDVRALFNHDPNVVLGRTKSGTLRLTEDAKGLFYDVTLPKTQAAADVRELIQRGDVSGSSFGFVVEEEEWQQPQRNTRDLPLRIITRASLFDVSPVTYPAYDQTTVSARSKEKAEAVAKAAPVIDEIHEAPNTAIVDALRVAERETMRAALNTAKAWRA